MRDLEAKRGKGTHQRGKGKRGCVRREKGSEGNGKEKGMHKQGRGFVAEWKGRSNGMEREG